MTDITELALLVSKAKASVFTLEYISQFEPADIDSDDVDLRFEVDGRDTGTNVSIVDECRQAAKVIGALVEALEKAQQRIDELQQGFIANQEEAHEAIKYATELKEQLARACAGREEAFREVDEMQKSLDHTHRRRTIWRGRAVTAEAEIAALRQRIADLESFRTAYMEWSDKTDWVNTDRRFGVVKPLGKHRADVLKAYIEHLEPRAVPVKFPHQTDFDDPLSAYEAIEKCKEALTAAGIKWEAE